jgi:CelD/BcsL family acetyltransferase involved in cellulose biosynthesis
MIVKAGDLNCGEISIVADDCCFRDLETDWSDLWQRACDSRFHQRHDWCQSAWLNCLRHQGYKLHIVCARQQGKLVAVLPLIKRNGLFRRSEYGFLTCLEHPKDVLVDRTVANSGKLQSLLSQMLATCAGRIKISPVRSGSLLHQFADSAKIVATPALNAHVAVLQDADLESFIRQTSKSAIAMERRSFRLLMREGPVSICLSKPDDDFDRVFGVLVQQKRAWLLARKKSSRWLLDDKAIACLQSFTKPAVAAGYAHLQSINVDGECVVVTLSFQDHGTLTCFMHSYHPAFGRFSCGRLGILAMMRNALRDDIRRFDFLGGTNDQKLSVTDQIVEQYAMEIKY